MSRKRSRDSPPEPQPRVTPSISSSTQYCERCRSANLVGFLSENQALPAKSKVAKQMVLMGPTLVVDHACAICRFFKSVAVNRLRPETCTNEKMEWKLSRYSSLRAMGITYSQQSLNKFQDTKMSFAFTLGYGGTDIEAETWEGFILPHSDDDIEPSSDTSFTYLGRKLVDRPNWELVLKWLTDCNEKHNLCRKPNVSIPHNLQVFDCQTRVLQSLPAGARYIALNYVWGSSAPQDSATNTGSPLQEKTLADAINAVRVVGERYLWVDRICIDQKNLERKAQLIKRMDSVYEAAYFTMVALVPNSEAGLPGLSVPRRIQPTLQLPSGQVLISTMRMLEDALEASRWNLRAWTFQEFCLSRRCLVFADDQVYFICKSGSTCESLHHRPISALPYQAHRCLDSRRLTSEGKKRADIFPSSLFEQNMTAYCRRELTCESDALDAFRGYLARCGLASYWGVPIFICLPNPDTVDHLNAGFAYGLSWIGGARPAQPHPSFPTWSWVSCRPGPKQYSTNRAYKGTRGKRLATNLSFHPRNLVAFARFSISRALEVYEPLFSESKVTAGFFEKFPLYEWEKKIRIQTIHGEVTEDVLQTMSRPWLIIWFDDRGWSNFDYSQMENRDGKRILHLLLLVQEKYVLERVARSFSKISDGREYYDRFVGFTHWMIVSRNSDSDWKRVGVFREINSDLRVTRLGIVEWDVV